jgi:hypothetical protein
MRLSKALITAIALTAANSFSVNAITNEQALTCVMSSHLPGVTGFGSVNAEKISIDSGNKKISVRFSENAAYIPFTVDELSQVKQECLNKLGSKYAGYSITLYAKDKDLDALALFAKKDLAGPTETIRFISNLDMPDFEYGLTGKNIAVWQSHGWYFEPKLNRWEWQRARIFQTVEDLYTQSYVMPFLMPMLQNAGAYVMSPRERDTNRFEAIVDNDGGHATGQYNESAQKGFSWKKTNVKGFAYTNAVLHENDNPFREGTTRSVKLSGKADQATASAHWNANIPKDGNYAIYISYASLPNSTTEACYTINAANGAHKFKINQKMGGGTWIYLGHFPLKAGQQDKPIVELTNEGTNSNECITADAVKIGGGMGNVARRVLPKEDNSDIDYQYQLSNYPRFTEGARYFLQWAGAPDSVYSESKNVNDYTDDYRSRALWVNWLAGGSSVLPKQEGLNIPIDLSFAFHSDAGTTRDDSIIGTLGIYCTANGKLGNGSTTLASRDFTNLVMTNIVNDVRRQFEPKWTRRGMWDKSYYEARVPAVPAMLLELLSHQNFADMKYGLDPTFRFVVSRAVYKGMLQFIAHRDGRDYVVQPLPVHAFAINGGNGSYKLSWSETVDTLEETAKPKFYIIEERINNGFFKQIAKTESTEFALNISDKDIHSYRVIAGNDGGVSFPSEILALCDLNNGSLPVVIINGFTRVSAPDTFDAGTIAGFYDAKDHGVPYISDISFIGSQFEYRREIPWMDDDAAGFGASRANYEDKVIAGNTFDYVYTHGAAVVAAGHSFISSSVEAFANSSATDTPKIADLILGKQKEIKRGTGAYGTAYKTFPAELQARLRSYTSAGGSVFVSGAYVASDLWDNEFSSKEVAKRDQDFARDVLGYNWRVGQASVTGEAYQVPTHFKAFTTGDYKFSNELNADCYAVESPDSFYPVDTNKCNTFMRYTENNLVAGTALNGDGYNAVVLGFPFETISDSSARNTLMGEILNFLDTNNK